MPTAESFRRQAQQSAVIPVIVVDEITAAVPLARALHDGGLSMIELTLRTPVALEAISEIRSALPEVITGAGTVLNAAQAAAAQRAGAQFAVSPGYVPELGRYCREHDLPLLPGAATATEVMIALADGFDFLKFFPAAASGGTAMLDALRGPFAEVSFCPTGGVSLANAASYLALANVLCIGGSWMAPRDAVREADWARITALASQSVSALRQQ